MMRVDADAGVLRLGGHHVEALLRDLGSPFAAGDAPSAELDRAARELIEAGATTASGQPVPAFAELLAPAVAPWLAGRVLVVGPRGETEHRLWVGPSRGLVVAHVRDGWYDLIPIAAGGTAAAVARLASLGPHPHRNGRQVHVAVDWAPGLFVDPADAEAASRTLALVSGQEGWFVLTPDGRDVERRAVTPSDSWQLLVAACRPPVGLWLDGPFATASR